MSDEDRTLIAWIVWCATIAIIVLLSGCEKTELLEPLSKNHNAMNIRHDKSEKLQAESTTIKISPISSESLYGTDSDCLVFDWNSYTDFSSQGPLMFLAIVWVHDNGFRQAGSLAFQNCDSIAKVGGDFTIYASNPQAKIRWNPIPTGQEFRLTNDAGGSTIIGHTYQPIVTETFQGFDCFVEWYY